jgi:MFS family permease
MIGVAAVTFLAGLLFGYDQGVISGALPLLQADLDLSTLESEIVTSWVTLGALFGALVAGGLADRIGRRWAAVAAGILFAIGALIEAVAPGAGLLTVGRVVTGLGVGFASVVAPLYAAEMARSGSVDASSRPTSWRSPSGSSSPTWQTTHSRAPTAGG